MGQLFLFFWTLTAGAHSALCADWKSTFGAELKVESVFHPERVNTDDRRIRSIGSLGLPVTLSREREWRFRLNPILQADPQNISKRDRYFFDPKEAFLQWRRPHWAVLVGWQQHHWGDMLVFNPLDAINPRDFRDPIRPGRLGVPSALVRWDSEAAFAELLYIPYQREARLPGEKSRWLPHGTYASRSVGTSLLPSAVQLPAGIHYRYERRQELDNALNDNFGLRLKFRWPRLDWTLAAFEGAAPLPILNVSFTSALIGFPTPSLQIDPAFVLQPVYYRDRWTASSLAWQRGDFVLRMANSYHNPKTKRRDLPGSTWENSLAFEQGLEFGSQNLIISLEGTYVDRNEAPDTSPISVLRRFDRAAAIGARWVPTAKWSLLTAYLRDFRFRSGMVQGELTFAPGDSWQVALSGAAIHGAAETPLGAYAENDRLALAWQLTW